ncbi:MAG TPA: HEPN domain-containing protein [Longimicrobiaceae bacterium]|nr:HEPN domain-containing protein [Longimicrobiaceae bacterium]
MPSRSLRAWESSGRRALDEIESAHQAVGGLRRGRRYATQQINQAYAVLLSSQFQRFCRDLHSEAVDHLIRQSTLALVAPLFLSLVRGRKLDVGNPNPGNIGSDFGRLGLEFWERVRALDPRSKQRQERLEELIVWRNAVAHQDFTRPVLGGRTSVRIDDVRRWRRTCEQLAVAFDSVMRVYLTEITGTSPW